MRVAWNDYRMTADRAGLRGYVQFNNYTHTTFFCLFGDVACSEYFFVPFPLSRCMESTSYVLSFRIVFFYNIVHEGGCRFMAAWVREEENASNQQRQK